MGDVQYRSNQNAAFRSVELNAKVEANGFIKTGPDSEVTINWNSGLSSEIKSNKTIDISNLYNEVHKKTKWVSQLKNQASSLALYNKKETSTGGAIRRSEVVISKQSELYWVMEPLESLEDAIALFDNRKYPEAITKLQKVIEQGPLKRDAEIAHSYLIMIYEDQNNATALRKQINLLKSDFPKSSLLEILPKDL